MVSAVRNTWTAHLGRRRSKWEKEREKEKKKIRNHTPGSTQDEWTIPWAPISPPPHPTDADATRMTGAGSDIFPLPAPGGPISNSKCFHTVPVFETFSPPCDQSRLSRALKSTNE